MAILNFYEAEAQRCRKTEAFLAGCVMASAVLEASLLSVAECYPEQARSSCKAPRGNKPFDRWTLAQLLDVAKDLGWLPAQLTYGEDEFDSERALVGDYAEVVREIRNLVHAGRYLADYKDDVTEDQLTLSFEVLQAVSDHLYAKVEQSLLAEMGRRDAQDSIDTSPSDA
jgi:hypothetical protein